MAPTVEDALAKLEREMPEALGEKIRALEETIIPAVASVMTTYPAESATGSATAVRGRRRVRLRYRSGMGEVTERR